MEGWTFESGYYPRYGSGTVACTIEVTEPSATVCAGCEYQIRAVSGLPVVYRLQEAYTGVSVNADGKVMVGTDAAKNADIVILIQSLYNSGVSSQVTLTVSADSYEFESAKTDYVFTWFYGASDGSNGEPLEYTFTKNGEACEEPLTFESENAEIAYVEGGKLIAAGDGATAVKIYVGSTLLATLNVTSNMYRAVTTQAELEAVGASLAAKYILMRDVDIKGGTFNTIAHYSAGAELVFNGIFDGNGHTIMNFTPVYNGTASNNSALFGQIGASGVVRNLNVVGVTLNQAIMGGIVTINYGTVENCFAETTIDYAESTRANNPSGGLVAKNYGTVRNCVAVTKLGTSATLTESTIVTLGAFVGRSYAGSVIENCYSVSPSEIGFYESATPTNEGGATALGTQTNIADYDSLEAFYEAVTPFDDWTFESGYYPHLGAVCSIAVSVTEVPVSVNTEYAIAGVVSNYPVYYSLKEDYGDVVSLDGDGNVTFGAVVAGERYVVVVASMYGSATTEITFTAISASLSDVALYLDFDGVSNPSSGIPQYSVTCNGARITDFDDRITFAVEGGFATVDGKTLTAVKYGVGTVSLYVSGTLYDTATLTVYKRVRTAKEMQNVELDLAGVYALCNDIDFEGAEFHGLSSYYGFTVGGNPFFTGIFDGQNFALKNLVLRGDVYVNKETGESVTDTNATIFGVLFATAKVRNLSVIGATTNERCGVFAAVNNGLIENCYAELYVAGTTNAAANFGICLTAIQNTKTGIVRNCAGKITYSAEVTDTTYVFGVSCKNQGKIENVNVLSEKEVLSVPSSGSTAAVNSNVFTEESGFTAEILERYDATVWSLTVGQTPVLKKNS